MTTDLKRDIIMENLFSHETWCVTSITKRPLLSEPVISCENFPLTREHVIHLLTCLQVVNMSEDMALIGLKSFL